MRNPRRIADYLHQCCLSERLIGYSLVQVLFPLDPVSRRRFTVHPSPRLKYRVTAPVTNTGDVAADEVVQLYTRDAVSTLVRPIRELKDFRRIHIEPGKTKIVELSLSCDKLAFFDAREQRVVRKLLQF
jgi:hypothetical protein